MKGRHDIIVRNRRVQYKFSVERNITILCGDSATGKTTLIDMIASYQRTGSQSGIEIRSDKPLTVLTELNWELILSNTRDSIVFIDEGERFVLTRNFARAAQNSDNYFVIATRASLPNLPYSTKEIYGIKNTSGNRYQGTKRLYAEFFPIYKDADHAVTRPDLVILEDTNAGFEFFSHYFDAKGIRCLSAGGKSNIFRLLANEAYDTALVIADGAAFGSEIKEIISLRKARNIIVYLPESFEWIILKSDVLKDDKVRDILDDPAEHIASETYFSWERFFTALLIEQSRTTYLQYSKTRLNIHYLQYAVVKEVEKVIPNIPL